LYDSNCGLNSSDFAINGSIKFGSDRFTIVDSSLIQPDGHFTFGYLEITSGAMSGLKRTIDESFTGILNLSRPLTQEPLTGTTFTVYPGCDRTLKTCKDKFTNDMFAGQPFIPVPEVLY